MIATACSLLFVPGDRPDRFDKAVASGADLVILDLEDAVLPDAKAGAREAVRAWLDRGGRAALRLNAADTEWHLDDLALARHPGILSVLLPKAEAGQVAGVAAGLRQGVGLGALIETAAGVLRAGEIAAAQGVSRLLFGSIDLSAETGIEDEGEAMTAIRAGLSLASAAAGLAGPVDGVTLALHDPERLAADCRRARRLGMAGKLCIHPAQVAGVHAGFAPGPEEIAAARKIVAAAEARGAAGALQLDGRMIDKPVVDRARRLLAALR